MLMSLRKTTPIFRAELKRLRKENAVLKQERDILISHSGPQPA
jgi:hypothetical protein